MQRGLDAGESEPEEVQRDTELTLGPAMLLGILVGLVLLCGLCFGLGYASGRRGSAQTAAATQSATAAPVPSQTGDSPSKPSATVAGVQQQRADVDEPPSSAQVGSPAESAADAVAAVPGATVPGASASAQQQVRAVQPLVRPALPPQGGTAQPSSGLPVQPAMSQAPGLMVQIAAVSHTEDAEVLVGALRRHGYSVTARRELGDGLIHVQVGPFNNRNDANIMCQRLLGDGYNASVRP